MFPTAGNDFTFPDGPTPLDSCYRHSTLDRVQVSIFLSFPESRCWRYCLRLLLDLLVLSSRENLGGRSSRRTTCDENRTFWNSPLGSVWRTGTVCVEPWLFIFNKFWWFERYYTVPCCLWFIWLERAVLTKHETNGIRVFGVRSVSFYFCHTPDVIRECSLK